MTRRMTDRLIGLPGSLALPATAARVVALRGCSVRLMLRPADSVGATDWVGQRVTREPRMHAALQGYRVGASSAHLLPDERALYLFIQTGN